MVGIVSRRGERDDARAALKRFSIKAENTEQAVATLSGGNQQKVVVARWMEAKVKLLVLEEPTIGVDVSSKAEIYHLLQLSLKNGMAVLLISSDFEEVEICHRALVFSRGHIAAEIPHDELTVARLTASATGGASVAQTEAAWRESPQHAHVRRGDHPRHLGLGSPGRSWCSSSSCSRCSSPTRS